jgi:periplasmic divalent cation tolerance protein
MTDKIIVLTTCASQPEAENIARLLVESHLAACVNILPGIRSVYHWQGKIQEETEILLVIKSRRALFEQLEKAIVSVHSYEVPEIIAIPIVEGALSYLRWLSRETEGLDEV